MSIVRNSLALFVMQVVIFVLGILVSIVVSRILGPTQRGVYFLVITINASIVGLGDLGINFTNTYLLAKDRCTLSKVNSNSIVFAVLIGTVTMLGYLTFRRPLHSSFLKEIEPVYMLVSIGLIPFSLYTQFWGSMMVGLNRMTLISKLGIATTVVSSILTCVVLLVFKLGIVGLLGLWGVSSITSALLRIYLLSREERIRIHFDYKFFKETFFFGIKGYLGNVAYHIYHRFDIFLINYFTGVTGVGYYSLAVSLAEKTRFLPDPIINASTPRIGSANKDDAKVLTSRVIRHTILLSAITAIILLFAAPWVIPFAYGDEFLPTITPLLILLPGTIFLSACFVLCSFFTYQLGRPEIPTICGWVALAVNLPLCIWLTAKHALIGASLAMSLTYLVAFLTTLIWYRKATRQPLCDTLLIKGADIYAYIDLLKGFLDFLRYFLVPSGTLK